MSSNHQINRTMKKLILAITVAAFTLGAQAGGEKCCAKGKAAATAKAGAECTAKTAATCTAGQAKCCAAGATAKRVVHSPRGAEAARS